MNTGERRLGDIRQAVSRHLSGSPPTLPVRKVAGSHADAYILPHLTFLSRVGILKVTRRSMVAVFFFSHCPSRLNVIFLKSEKSKNLLCKSNLGHFERGEKPY